MICTERTSSHVFDATYPGVRQVLINLGSFWDSAALKDCQEEIIRLTDENASCHARCRRFLSAYSSLNADLYAIASGALNHVKLSQFAGRFVKRYFPKKPGTGTIRRQKLSALTQYGYLTQPVEAGQTFLLCDDLFAGADSLLQTLSDILTERGYDLSVSPANLVQGGYLEHIVIPDASIALLSSTCMNHLQIPEAKRINFGRFYDAQILRGKKQRLDFSKKAAAALKEEAVSSLVQAKKIHDQLEAGYINAMDFSKVEQVRETIQEEILARCGS